MSLSVCPFSSNTYAFILLDIHLNSCINFISAMLRRIWTTFCSLSVRKTAAWQQRNVKTVFDLR